MSDFSVCITACTKFKISICALDPTGLGNSSVERVGRKLLKTLGGYAVIS